MKIKKSINILIILVLICSAVLPTITGINTKTKTETHLSKNSLLGSTLFIKVEEIRSYDNPDPWPWAKQADFKLKVKINDKVHSKNFNSDDNHIYPNWIISETIDGNEKFVKIIFTLLDRDVDSDDICDIDPNENDRKCEIIYDLETESWSGDDGGDGNSRGCQPPECEIWFDVWNDEDPTEPLDIKILKDDKSFYRTNTPITLTASVRNGKAPYRWNWQIKGRNNLEFKTKEITFTLSEPGEYKAILNVIDSEERKGSDSITLYVYTFYTKCKYPGDDKISIWFFDNHFTTCLIPPLACPELTHGDHARIYYPSDDRKGFEIWINKESSSLVSKICVYQNSNLLDEEKEPYKVNNGRCYYWLDGLKEGRNDYRFIVEGKNGNILRELNLRYFAKF